MRQAIMTTPGQIEFREADEPEVGADDILLRIKRIGVCGSDIHVYHGKHPFTSYPVVQGHEFSAIVEAVGTGITDIKPGAKVTARPQVVCGQCKSCLRGDYNICDKLKVEGFQCSGCAQDLFLTTRDKIVVLPDDMSLDEGALIEPVSVAVHATGRGGDLKGKNVVVAGAGTIGNLVAQVARCRGAKKVLITDLSDYRLGIAQKCNVDRISNPGSETLAQACKDFFGEEGFDIAFEAAGAEATMTALVDNINKGGKIVVLGVFEEAPRIDMSIVGDRELNLIGTLMYKHEDYLKAVKLIHDGQVITKPMITKHFAFEDYLEAYKYIEEMGDKSLKVMIDI